MESELKLRLNPSALDTLRADPLLADVRATHKQLDNIYFDTPQRDLAQMGIAVRLRHDGRRWLQTIKGANSGQAGLHRREEIEFAVKGENLEWPPLEGSPLEGAIEPFKNQLTPRFRTRFKREIYQLHGPAGAAIEMAIDHGEILAGEQRQPLCEVELELLSGPVDDLFAIALPLISRHPLVLDNRSKAERGDRLASSAPLGPPVKAAMPKLPAEASAPAVARIAIEECMAHWQGNEAGFLSQSGDSEYLHQIRVAVRRLRVACGPLAAAAHWQKEPLAPIRSSLRQLGQQLGEARDWDVFIEETWPPLARELNDAELLQTLTEAASLLRDTASLKARAALQGRESQRLLLQLGRCLAQPETQAEQQTASLAEDDSKNDLTARLDELDHKLRQALPKLAQLSPPRLHELRIVAKKLRYLTEFIGSRYEHKAVEDWLEWLKHAQTIFGARNDREVAQMKIEALCAGLPHKSGKVQHALQKLLNEQALPHLKLSHPPDPYW